MWGLWLRIRYNDLFTHRVNNLILHEHFVDSKFSLFDLDCLQKGVLVLLYLGMLKFGPKS